MGKGRSDMVSAVLQFCREQCCRMDILSPMSSPKVTLNALRVCFLFLSAATLPYCNTAPLAPALAKDFGIQGNIWPIEEEDPIVLIQNKLKGIWVWRTLNHDFYFHKLLLNKKPHQSGFYPIVSKSTLKGLAD